jgi:hypothetical protein
MCILAWDSKTTDNLFSLTNHPTVHRRTSVEYILYSWLGLQNEIVIFYKLKHFKERDEIVKCDNIKFNVDEDEICLDRHDADDDVLE